MNKNYFLLLAAFTFAACLSVNATAQTKDDSDLAQELTNPVADLMTIPIQVNVDRNIGLNDEGRKTTINIQPVVPFKVAEDWNLITRTIVPLVKQKDIFPGAGSQSGLGDITLQLFFSPRKPTSSGVIWGGGAVFLLPTASDSLIGAEKWGAGPAGVALKMSGSWTYGGLANHVWSFAGDDGRADISNTFVQPFVAYTWPNAWTVSLQSETNYNWKLEEWSIPVNVAAAKLVFFGRLPVSLQAGVGRWLETPDAGPEDWRFRLQANIVLPK
jgi:hypothetical protein